MKEYTQHTVKFVNGDYEYAFANGITLWKSTLTIDNIGFPIRHQGDVFCMVRSGEIKTAADIPANFRNW